jgi:hypothetical protein
MPNVYNTTTLESIHVIHSFSTFTKTCIIRVLWEISSWSKDWNLEVGFLDNNKFVLRIVFWNFLLHLLGVASILYEIIKKMFLFWGLIDIPLIHCSNHEHVTNLTNFQQFFEKSLNLNWRFFHQTIF